MTNKRNRIDGLPIYYDCMTDQIVIKDMKNNRECYGLSADGTNCIWYIAGQLWGPYDQNFLTLIGKIFNIT